MWDREQLQAEPIVHWAPELDVGDVRAVFLESVPWRGRETRAFGYFGLPALVEGESVPAMVLIHGGGGSAFVPWVEMWTRRGYAAIAIDTCGAIGLGAYSHPRHAWSGPPGWGGFDQIDWPLSDQWAFHAVSAVARATSFIASRPGVDASRVGVTGVSWGGYLASLHSGVDPRAAFVAPVYGAGHLSRFSRWKQRIWQLGERRARRWEEAWDPAHYLSEAKMPFLWIAGTNDSAFDLEAISSSAALGAGEAHFSIRPGMIHDHGGPGERPAEIHRMADAILRGRVEQRLMTVAVTSTQSGEIVAAVSEEPQLSSAELWFTRDRGTPERRTWQSQGASHDRGSSTVRAALPEDAAAYFISVTDATGCISSSAPWFDTGPKSLNRMETH